MYACVHEAHVCAHTGVQWGHTAQHIARRQPALCLLTGITLVCPSFIRVPSCWHTTSAGWHAGTPP